MPFRGPEKAHRPPRRLVGQTDKSDLAAGDELAQYAEDLVDGMAVALQMEVIEAFEHAHRPVRPVQLVEVDVIGLKALEAALDRLHDLGRALPRRGPILAQPGHLAPAGDLGRDHHFVALPARGEPGADNRLGASLRLRLGRDRVDFRSVDEIDAAAERVVQLGVALGFGVLLAERHGAETKPGHLDAAPAKLALLHPLSFLPSPFGKSQRQPRARVG